MAKETVKKENENAQEDAPVFEGGFKFELGCQFLVDASDRQSENLIKKHGFTRPRSGKFVATLVDGWFLDESESKGVAHVFISTLLCTKVVRASFDPEHKNPLFF